MCGRRCRGSKGLRRPYKLIDQSWNDSNFQSPSSSGKVEAIKVHHLVPRSHEVFHKRLLRVITCIDFREGPELGVGTEDEINDSTRPLEFARRPIAPLQHAFEVADFCHFVFMSSRLTKKSLVKVATQRMRSLSALSPVRPVCASIGTAASCVIVHGEHIVNCLEDTYARKVSGIPYNTPAAPEPLGFDSANEQIPTPVIPGLEFTRPGSGWEAVDIFGVARAPMPYNIFRARLAEEKRTGEEAVCASP